MKWSIEMLENLQNFMYLYKNPKLLFPFFILCNFIFPLLNALVYVDILKRFSRQFIWPHFLNFWRVLISRSQKQKLTVPRFRKSGISNLISVPRWSSNRPRCICFSPSYKSENVHAKIAIFFFINRIYLWKTKNLHYKLIPKDCTIYSFFYTIVFC